ncbi:MAG TPA: peptidylprolyl isomerase [Aequorivita sp.]|jgi:peptidyl-prolyl cis-trans isomerase SurA|nr:peptidylprolyl isomerase [Aequorivita sp.]MBP41676.1 peptidylprolyl isomerase [Aequorivita sp.]HBC03553.1 peptidylprolyl isomerase [Aequorivita sp.]HNP67500.1 peptidylprolyl isomerase [Aequorivita sp.]|tara:strand:- start:28670 stop:30628 length:1959 start_codon:yes stop_codon:yes gene_type:complete
MMKKFLSLFILVFLSAMTVFSQNKKEVLMTINGKPVFTNEFKRVYKKNLDLVQDESQKDIDGYLELFIDYKLKIAEAQAQGLDQESAYQSEFSKYRDQLSRNYLFEDKVTEELAKEAYERGKFDIAASHILIRVDYESVPQDTLAAYNKIKSIREKALKGEDFTGLAKTYSEEPGAKERGGDLGYFSVFTMVYPFETAAYNTPVGEISEIVRTSFGYHIIKVKDRRAKLPKIGVSHIMISDKKGARTFNPEERINEIYTMLKQGESFESLAKQFSDDKNSAVKGGKLNPFTKGDLRASEFEDAAYDLKKIGDISKPVKTDFGWHIIRLDEKLPVETFEEQKQMLEKKVSEGDRSKLVSTATNNKIKQKYGFKKEASFLPYFDTYVGDEVLKRKWVMEPIPASEEKTLFTIGDRKVGYTDFAKFIENRQRTTRPYKHKEAFLVELYNEFETEQLKDYFKEKLEVDNEEYAAVLNEYRDGLLIFDVMNKNIWQKAKTDSLGLDEYYNKTKADYQWKQRVDADIYSATSENIAKQIQTMLAEGKTAEEIKASLNTEEKVNVLITPGLFEIDQHELPKNLEINKGVSSIYPNNDSFVVVNIKEVLAPDVKALDEVKGKVLSNYQNDIEASWMENLRKKYNVDVNKKALKHVKKDLK